MRELLQESWGSRRWYTFIYPYPADLERLGGGEERKEKVMQIIDPVDEQIDITIDRVYRVDWLNRQYVQYVERLDSI